LRCSGCAPESRLSSTESGNSHHCISLLVRPGHPTLFGGISLAEGPGTLTTLRSMPRNQKGHAKLHSSACPGNPMACAACLRFFVIPYLRYLHGSLPERRIPCRIWSREGPSTGTDFAQCLRVNSSPQRLIWTCFAWPSARRTTSVPV